ncbi:hypothetical protein AAFM46_10885 [Arthrobacter sp. TMP15]|uniref:hypothetical protein n=1 Tax=Arthrobacter sp. TMP15 TaxID=3140789 RepID=UPI0031BA5765
MPETVNDQAPAFVIPRGTDELAWKMAAAWADVPVALLLADTASVKSTHYIAALRVCKSLDLWLERHDAEAAQRAEEEAATGSPLADEISQLGAESFIRIMMLAEEFASLTTQSRDRGDAVRASKYSGFESALLQVAAGLQVDNDIEVGK